MRKRKIVAGFLAIIGCISYMFSVSASTYTSSDLCQMKKYLLGYSVSLKNFDVDGNGQINLCDLIRMKKIIVSENHQSGYDPAPNETPFIPKNRTISRCQTNSG